MPSRSSIAALGLLCLCGAFLFVSGEDELAASSGSGTLTSLGSYNVNLTGSMVGGLSSGAYFAVQMHVTWSSIIAGTAIFAGGPYNCAEGLLATATTTCMEGFPLPDTALYIANTQAKYSNGHIDNPANLRNAKVYMYSGRIDETVHRTVMDHLLKYYQNYVNLTNIQYETTINSGHTLPTLNWGAPCYDTQSPYIGKCNYDGAGISLQQIFGKLNPANRGTLSGNVIEFNQREFINPGLSMPEQGFVYVPASCAKNESCRLFVALHGCEQGFGDVGTDFVVHTGFNEWADTNNIIVLYPQAARSQLIPFNPMGCWNWWGYNDNPLGYDDKRGIQAQAILAMMGRIAQNVSTADL